MDNQKNNDYRYMIPVNVKTRFELIPGLGIPELIRVGIVGGVSILFYFLLGLFPLPQIMKVLICIVPPIFTGMLYIKNDLNECFIQNLKNMMNFNKSQKRYLYQKENNR